MNQQTPHNNTVFAFDLHGVIFQRDYARMAKILWKFPHKFKLCIALCNPLFWLDALKLAYNKGVAEQFIVSLARKHKRLLPFIPLGITIANTQRPVPQMVALLKELTARGYQLHIFSNIGALCLADLRPQHPDIFALFASVTIPTQENGYIRKPSEQAFNNFFANSGAAPHNIIFIDDSRSNIRAAQRYGIHGIYFRSPALVHDQLRVMGI